MKILIILAVVLMLSGCFTQSIKPIEVEQRIIHTKIFHPQLPAQISLNTIEWKVLTPEILEQYIIDYKNGDADLLIVYSLSVDDYTILAENIAKIKKLLKDQKEIIIHYRTLE